MEQLSETQFIHVEFWHIKTVNYKIIKGTILRGVAAETRQILNNLELILKYKGATRGNITYHKT
jgi:hypothetical protein